LSGSQIRPHRNRAVGQAFGGRDEIRPDSEIVDSEWRPKSSKSSDDFIENQENSVPIAYPAQAFQIAVCTENLIRVDEVMESPKLAE
jgi:hypothetical protein